MSPKTLPLPKPPDSTVELESLESKWEKIHKVQPLYNKPEDGDITRRMYADHYRISVQSAEERMKALVETGKWILVMVKGGYGDRPRLVLREVKND